MMSRMPGYKIRRLKSASGITLVEVLLTVVIMAVSLTLIIQSLAASMRAVVFTGDYSRAVLVAENAMFEALKERFISTGYSLQGEETVYDKEFEYELEAAPPETLPFSDSLLNEITLKVAWPSGQRQKTISIATFFFTPPENVK